MVVFDEATISSIFSLHPRILAFFSSFIADLQNMVYSIWNHVKKLGDPA